MTLTPLILFSATAFGLLVGSFFNVLIWRIPRNESIVFPGSHCPGCNRPIKPYENIPVLSYLFLRGQCAGCKTAISWRYPFVEALTSAFCVLLCISLVLPRLADFGNPFLAPVRVLEIISLLVLIPITFIDFDHFIIPDRFTIPGLALGIAVCFLPGGLTPLQCLFGILAGGGTLMAAGLIGEFVFRKGEAMGFGDVKLMAFLGAVWGWEIGLMGIVFASLLGSIVGGLMLLTRRLNADHRIPFGPYLAAGVISGVLAGDRLVAWYFTALEGVFAR